MLRRFVVLGCALAIACAAQNQPPPKKYQIADATAPVAGRSFSLDVTADRQWTDTGIDVLVGTRLLVTASGSLQYSQAQAAGPDGLSRGWKDLLRSLPRNDAGRGALIGRIGDGDLGGIFLIGARSEIRSTLQGRLFLGINQMANEVASGSYRVSVEVLEAGSATTAPLAVSAADTTRIATTPGVNQALSKLPRRVSDPQGNPGDMVNFLILGTEDRVKQAFTAAGWVVVDRTRKDAVLHGLIATLSKQAYVEVPMSELYLFGRPQDYGMAHAEPFAVAASRHHLRIWKAPFQVDGQTLWVGAATHDVGFDRDQRNNGITHKIDPNVDDERKFVAQSLSATGLIASLGYVLPRGALTEARTATGESFHSDGKLLVMTLGESVAADRNGP